MISIDAICLFGKIDPYHDFIIKKIFPKLKAQILQMRYQNVQEGSSFTKEKENVKFLIYHHVFISQN